METNHNPNVHRCRAGGKEIILVGTAHVSRESAELVRRTIEAEKPDTVCVELCASRYQAIRQQDQWREMDIVKVVREKKAFLLLSNLMLAAFQKRIAQKLDVVPGQEMLTAMETADAVGARIHLADRDIRVTLSRTWRIMGFRDRMKLLFQLILSMGDLGEISEADVERMKEQDILESLLDDVGRSLPVLKSILIDERDQYLTHRIRTAPGSKIVAVVGAGHVPGILAGWEKEIDIAALEEIPPKGRLSGALKWLLPLLIAAIFLVGFFGGGAEAGARMAFSWVVANGVFAGLGAAAALAHPATVVSAVAAAPLTSLNPMVAAGWVSGLVEALVKKPRVMDFEDLPKDILSVRGFWRNKVTRVLLVVVFTNLGSTVGTFVAIPLMVNVLG
ncbi:MULTISPECIES: TraB/GumN family protein [Desulfococcus]|uniref:TraB family protein n=1 Tax=Desulfococcus multivorans DSM 2059 TaxID=1121405 RepID=S7TGN7_DESML|nr:TraB/GumN family protein [Desulfococcus multivorans]AQV02104.1 conjugal transfer protein TraB [Desulfococcus multivorans]EPR35951.1 TraB family protein [Desulfococcus multivorans DSM 2059]SJZ35751.1 pheromone shutdown-related protein TraB [Desulfococcus multivorans DSM 2059]